MRSLLVVRTEANIASPKNDDKKKARLEKTTPATLSPSSFNPEIQQLPNDFCFISCSIPVSK
jgi:hypothetical protein